MLTRRDLGLSVAAAGLTAGLSGRATAEEAISPVQTAAQTAAQMAAQTLAQTPLEPVSLDDRFFGEGRYLPLYLDMQANAAAGDPPPGGQLSQYAAFLGDEATAVGGEERDRDPTALLPDLADAEARDALEAIVAAAASTRVVILNEAHNVSGHRAFANRVMRALRPLGFDWFAAETFTPPQEGPAPDIGLYREGMPFAASLGYYTYDPVYAEMVREAARLGYRFAAYEQRWNQQAPEGASRLEAITARETAEADNLIEMVLRTQPEAKVFVYCGYSHAMETPGDGGEWFASRLKAKSGIDPLTIEQSQNWPATRPEADVPHVAAVLKRFAPTKPIVVSRGGEIVASPRNVGRMDLSVFHPRLPPVSGRPGWLATDPERRPMTVALPTFEGPALLQAIRSGEGAGSVPADQFLLTPGQATATLFLHPGAYLLRLERAGGIDAAFGAITVAA